jgi:F-type H+-transporting ATPase subunit delta
VQPTLEGYSFAVLTALSDADRATTVADLESLNDTVLARSDLRAALTDTAVAPAARSAVLADLLQGKVNATVVRLASFAAKVVPAQEVPTTIEELTHFANVLGRAEGFRPPLLSLLAARKRVGGYAAAVLESVSSDEFGNIEDDLFRWARTVESNRELRGLLVDRDATVESRLAITRQLLEDKVSDPTLRLALYVIEGGRARDVVGTLDYLVDYVANARNWRVGRVWSVRTIDDASRQQLVSSLEAITGHAVELQVELDPTLLSGVVVQIGDLRLDGSTKGRLSLLHETFGASFAKELQSNPQR